MHVESRFHLLPINSSLFSLRKENLKKKMCKKIVAIALSPIASQCLDKSQLSLIQTEKGERGVKLVTTTGTSTNAGHDKEHCLAVD